MGWAMLFTLVMCIWGGGYKFLLKTDRNVKGPAMDLFDAGYIWYLSYVITVAVRKRSLTQTTSCTCPTVC